MDPLQIFDDFKLDTLDEKWSDEVWENEFISFPEPPVDYSMLLGSEDMEAFLNETCKTVKQWIAQNISIDKLNDQERPEVSWQTLNALNINVKGLLAVLGYLIKVGQASGADEDSRQACLASASLYLTLLSIPGSSTFNIFHPNLYHRTIDTLKFSEYLIEKKKNPRDLESLYEDQSEELLKSEKVTLTKGLNSILYDLITMLKTFYMKYQINSLEITIMALVEVTRLETETNLFQTNQSRRSDASKTSLSYNAYVALQDLCDPRHGKIEDTIRLIMKCLLPHLCPNYLDLPSRAANVVWDTIINFFRNLLTSQGVPAESGMEILIQHLLVKCPERSEPRQKQAAVVSKLINICYGDLFHKCIEHLINFAFHNRIAFRIFAQEVIGKLLIDMFINPPDNEIDKRKKVKVVLIATVLSRCVDTSSMVRGKAMSTLESIISNEKTTVEDFVNTSEEDKSLPTEEVLLDALSEDTNPLPGSNILNCMLLKRIQDERALVRKSAIHALQNLLTHFPILLDKVAPIIGRHCRDLALSVRRDAIDALANLLQCHPLNQNLLDEYIKSVLPRIYDVETKVQEKVLESLKNLVLNKIKKFTEKETDEAKNLPWRIINYIVAKRMRKNLSKVCDYWVKENVITNSVINGVQSHIGTDHDMEAWILLVAFAENMKLPDMKKHFENYNTIFEGDDFVATLKLEVLRYTWHGMGRDYLQNLHSHLYECLCKFRIRRECIGICMDIFSGITKRLNAADGETLLSSHAAEIIKLSEAQIQQLMDENDKIEEEKVNIYLKAMCALGHSSFLCSQEVSESTLSIIQSILLDCDSIVIPEQYIEKFKAAGVVLLGQQGMRNREVAEEVMPILGQLMCKKNTSESLAQAAIRINAVKALADLCIRFTALVEPYLPDMCICMKDPNSMVREAIVVIFVQLLLEDYIKVKGAFFYHILTMLSDNDETIRELTIFLIKERLLVKNKTLISQSFIPSVFHYNNCQTRYKFNNRKIRKKEKDALTLPGQKNESKRRAIYDFMLEHLDPPSKLKILTKLNSEVLEGVCEKFINIKQTEGVCVVKDVLYIISNDRMQPSFGNKVQQEDDCQDETAENPVNNALNVIAEGIKKFKFTVMLQTLIKLRQFLTACKSPLLFDVSKFFIKVLSDFNKDQLAEIYDEHPELKKDIERDISKHGKKPETNDSEEHETEAEIVIGMTEETSMTEEINITVETNVIKKTSVIEKVSEIEDISITEANESCLVKKKDVNANVSKINKSKQKSGAVTPRKIQDIILSPLPRIVLRRLSTLTYPGIKSWISPPRETRNSSQSSDPEPSTSGISVSSGSPVDEISSTPSPDLFEPDIFSTPKPKKIARLSRDIVQKL